MILRLIRGRAGHAQLESLRDELAGQLPPADAGGPVRWHLGARGATDEREVLVVAAWESAELVARRDAAGRSAWSIAQRRIANAAVEHFEVDRTVHRRTGHVPVAIRVATGRFSRPGTDIEMQQLLRERMPSIGQEMCEAYVGRRLDGRSIEVTFVSAWQALPEDRQLDRPFWPDIALRYDSFSVEVYETVR